MTGQSWRADAPALPPIDDDERRARELSEVLAGVRVRLEREHREAAA